MGQTALSESLRGVEAEIAARQLERALMLSQEVQARFPRALAVQRVIGEVYLALRKTREAIGALDRALAGDPEDARACCARAIVQQIQGDSMGALAWYRRACDIRPNDTVLLSAYRELARSLDQPAYAPSRTGLARLYLRGDLFPHAIREWETILAERPDALEAQLGLAETLWRARNTQAAAECCRRLLLNAPSCVKALLILAAIEHDDGKDDEARNQLRRAGELDPDMRIAQELFADRLAANDRALSLLVFGQEPLASRGPSVPLAQPARSLPTAAPGQMTEQVTGASGIPAEPRPSVPVQPAARINTGALAQPQPLSPQAPSAASATSAPASRPNSLPADFHRIFSETKDMLWRDDAEGQETQGRMPSAPASDRSRGDPFAGSQVVMPPALMSAGGSLEDTEARLAMNFLGWLQAQGALARRTGMPDAQGSTGPVPIPLPPRQHPTGRPVDDPRYPYGPDGETGPLPPTSEALKAMFAELEPETAAPRIVDADPATASHSEDIATDELSAPPAPPAFVSGPLMPPIDEYPDASGGERVSWMPASGQSGDVESAGQTEAPDAFGWAAFASPAESATDDSSPYSAFSGFAPTEHEIPAESATVTAPLLPGEKTQSVAPDIAEGAGSATGEAMTLEALEHGFERSGFESYDLRPGELAAIAAQMPPSTPDEQTPAAEAEVGREAAASSAPSPEPAHKPAGPAPDDYAGRLSLARESRTAGNLDDALGEYRIILKNAPDLLGDVVDELNESLAAAPEHPEVHRLLGDAHIRQGDYLSALESYNRAVALTQAQGS